MPDMTIQENSYPYLPVLLVDDESEFLLSAEFALSSYGLNNVITENDSRKVREILKQQEFSAIVLDLYMPYVTGLDLLPEITAQYPNTPVIILTAVNEIETAVDCMKNGAFDYQVKPIDDERLITSVKRAVTFREMQTENQHLRESILDSRLKNPDAFANIVTADPAMLAIFKYVEAVSDTSLPVLITGETGVGKELFAHAVHELSGRKGSFVTVNVSGIDDTMFSDSLFGHVKGAFTGADSIRNGLVEQAANGTLFLDEIGDLAPESQVKLLRLLQEGTYFPLGSDMPKLSNARVVVATHRNLDSMMQQRTFRQDLFYRLRAHHIEIPPLRKRAKDLDMLIDHFLDIASEKLGRKRPTAPQELYTLMKTYSFPGNVRELEGLIFDAVSRHQSGILSMTSIMEKLPDTNNEKNETVNIHSEDNPLNITFPESLPTLKSMEQLLIDEALRRADGNQTIAARLLGLSRRALNNRLNRE